MKALQQNRIRQIFIPALLGFATEIQADKIALGTDYPFPLGEEIAGSLIESMSFDKQTKAKLFYGATLAWLNLKIEHFI